LSRRKNRKRPSVSRRGSSARKGPSPSPRVAFLEASRRLLAPDVSASPPREPAWKYLWWILGGAFAVRVAVALSGDFVVHPDEIMQSLEPAHGAVFGNGVVYWEFFYGARSWLVPGTVAAVLAVVNALAGGEAEPALYIAAVKVFFCALSLIVPLSMYIAGRNWFGETTGRLALLLGAFWYELVGYAHKPMTEFVATIMLFGTMALVSRPHHRNTGAIVAVGLIGVLLVAVRLQYAPLAAVVLLSCLLGIDRIGRIRIVVAGAVGILLVGLFEYLTWGGLFASYRLNLAANFELNRFRADESSAWYYPGWLLLASGGAVAWAVAGGVADFRRRGLPCILLLALLIPHMWQVHREYRFIFAAVPLWLLLFADVLARGVLPAREEVRLRPRAAAAGLAFALLVSVLGILNAIPEQHLLYVAKSSETGRVNFLRGQDPMFSAYRHLAADDTVTGVWDVKRPYFNTGGYYYLHGKVPLYDYSVGANNIPLQRAEDYVSHIVAGPYVTPQGFVRLADDRPAMRVDDDEHVPLPAFVADAAAGELVYRVDSERAFPIEGFVLARDFDGATVWKREPATPSRRWKDYRISPDSEKMLQLLPRTLGNDGAAPARNFNIEWASED